MQVIDYVELREVEILMDGGRMEMRGLLRGGGGGREKGERVIWGGLK